MSEYTYKMQANILAAQVKQLELSLTTMRKEINSLWFEREKLIGALEDCLGFVDELKDHGINHWSGETKAHAVLAEAKEKV